VEFRHKHLLGIQQLSVADITAILDTADSLAEISTREVKKVPALRGKTIVNLIFEPSTQSCASFELAAKRLSADVVQISHQTGSPVTGEALKDTVLNLEAMNPDALIIRHPCSGAAHYVSTFCRSHVINAGDGAHEHPVQALLDAFTIRQFKISFKNLKVVIVGDVMHSRVARSNIFLLSKFGAKITLVGPPCLVPSEFKNLGVGISPDFDKALPGADVIMLLRIQRERLSEILFPSIREYRTLYCLDERRYRLAAPDAIIMHAGPIHRGVEISSPLADSVKSVILKQAENGIAVWMAVLYLLLGGKQREPAD
jgi:aspartate carbamoyltransferase catalytic subunit